MMYGEIEAVQEIFEDPRAEVSSAAIQLRRMCELDPPSADAIRHYYDLTASQARREAWQFGRLPARGLIRTRAKRARAMKRLAIAVMAWQDQRAAAQA